MLEIIKKGDAKFFLHVETETMIRFFKFDIVVIPIKERISQGKLSKQLVDDVRDRKRNCGQ